MTAPMPSRLVSKYPLCGRAVASDILSLDGRFIVVKGLRYGWKSLVIDEVACPRLWLIPNSSSN